MGAILPFVKVLVACVPQTGHLRPMIPLLSSLVAAGHDVVVATGTAVRGEAESTGARFEPAGRGLDLWFGQLAARTRGQPGDGLPPGRIAPYFVPRLFCEIGGSDMVDDVLAAGERLRPDVVVFDAYAYVGPLVARLLGARPVNHLFGPLPEPDVTQLAADAMSPLWRTFGVDVPPDAGVYAGATIAVCPPSMDRAVPPRGEHHRLRPAPSPLRDATPQSPPLVYFSLGTMWSSVDVVRTVLGALGELPVRVVATLGQLDPSELADVPPNVELHQYIPQQHVLPDAAMVIHHAGAGTMFGALAHGLPQVALPQAADNFVNAAMLSQVGAAAILPPDDVSKDSVREAVRRVLDDVSYSRAATAVAEEIAAMPTPNDVAAALFP